MSISIGEARSQLFEILKRDSFFEGEITLSSGKKSNYYLDARRTLLNPQGAYLTALLILDQLKDDKLTAIGGPTLGADPMVGAVASLSYQQGNPVNSFIIRKEPKGHGKMQQIEGPELGDDPQLVVIDDVATTGKAFLMSLDVLEKIDIKPVKCLSIIDREEGASEALAERGVELVSIFKGKEFFNKS